MNDDREAMVQAVVSAIGPENFHSDFAIAEAAIDALAPFIAAAEQRGREQAAQAIEGFSGWIAIARAIAPVLDSLEVVVHKPVQGEAMHKVIGYHVAQEVARLARGEQP